MGSASCVVAIPTPNRPNPSRARSMPDSSSSAFSAIPGASSSLSSAVWQPPMRLTATHCTPRVPSSLVRPGRLAVVLSAKGCLHDRSRSSSCVALVQTRARARLVVYPSMSRWDAQPTSRRTCANYTSGCRPVSGTCEARAHRTQTESDNRWFSCSDIS